MHAFGQVKSLLVKLRCIRVMFRDNVKVTARLLYMDITIYKGKKNRQSSNKLAGKCNLKCFLNNNRRPLFEGSETGKAENETRLSEGESDLAEKRRAGGTCIR